MKHATEVDTAHRLDAEERAPMEHVELAALTRQIERAEAKARDASAAVHAQPDDTLDDAYRAGELVGRAQGLALAALLARRVLEALERERRS